MCALRPKIDKVRSADIIRQSTSGARQKRSVRRERFLLHSEKIPGFAESNSNSEPNGDGQVSYKPEYAHIAKLMCCKGATNAELADAFKVSVDVITSWRAEHEEFSQACTLGEKLADARVQHSLFERAVGYDYVDEKVIFQQGRPLTVKNLAHMPANVTAAKLWLANRQPGQWSVKPRPDYNEKPDDPLKNLMQELSGTALRPKEE